jgi:hypothetical protein
LIIKLPRVEFTSGYNTILNLAAFFSADSGGLDNGAKAEGTATGFART